MTKQYLLLCGDETRVALEGALKGIEFLEVQGLNLNNENKLNLLVTPVIPPVNPACLPAQMPIPPAPEPSVVEEEAPNA